MSFIVLLSSKFCHIGIHYGTVGVDVGFGQALRELEGRVDFCFCEEVIEMWNWCVLGIRRKIGGGLGS